jgi:hypothetical protein
MMAAALSEHVFVEASAGVSNFVQTPSDNRRIWDRG